MCDESSSQFGEVGRICDRIQARATVAFGGGGEPGVECRALNCEVVMRTILSGFLAVACACAALIAQGDPQPTCKMCPGTYIPKAEVDAYVSKAIAEKLTDQQVRDIE